MSRGDGCRGKPTTPHTEIGSITTNILLNNGGWGVDVERFGLIGWPIGFIVWLMRGGVR